MEYGTVERACYVYVYYMCEWTAVDMYCDNKDDCQILQLSHIEGTTKVLPWAKQLASFSVKPCVQNIVTDPLMLLFVLFISVVCTTTRGHSY